MTRDAPPSTEGAGRSAPPSTASRIIRGLITVALLGAGAFGFWKYKQHAKEKEAAAKKASDLGTGPQQTLVRVQKTRVTRVYRRTLRT